MFTGIIEEIGTVKALKPGILELSAKKVLEDVHIGDSIAVNGVCLTVTSFTNNSFCVDVMPETFRRTSLGQLSIGKTVNLERAMAANGRFGGHIVAGHIDDTGTISNIHNEGNAVWITIDTPSSLLKYIIEKGSITIDGISLTVAKVTNHDFCVSIIPHTGEETTLLSKRIGDKVNLECDMIGKYVEKLLSFREPNPSQESNITLEFLAQHGF
ncbi:MAG: riboflavin synthase [Lachnospiraceae bacterium]|nr:riboflavin synthase [Lachnospiraceae bacterium]